MSGESEGPGVASPLPQETAQRDRITADLRAANETLNKLKATAPMVQQQADAYDKLVKDGFFSPLAVQDKQREAINLRQDLKSQEATVAGLAAQIAAQDKLRRQGSPIDSKSLSDGKLPVAYRE